MEVCLVSIYFSIAENGASLGGSNLGQPLVEIVLSVSCRSVNGSDQIQIQSEFINKNSI